MSTKIEWCDETWNPITGCTPISDGCKNCYAARMAKRLAGRYGYPADDPFWVTFHPDRLDEPLKWKKPRRVFVCSMGDLFHCHVALKWFQKIYIIIMECKRLGLEHKFLVLTKRPERMSEWVNPKKPLDNLWLGVTAENQRCADERIPILLQIPAAMRFVSIEPMLGPVDLNDREFLINKTLFKYTLGNYLDWVILGCESGPSRRLCAIEWMIDVVRQCDDVNIPVFVKQVSINGKVSKNPAEWPEELRRREFPKEG